MSEVPEPAPSPLAAVLLTLAAVALQGLAFVVLAPLTGTTFALAVGVALGFGLLGGLIARQIPAPAEVALGLVGFRRRLLAIGLLLLPAVVLASEADNLVADFIPRPAQIEATAPGAAETSETDLEPFTMADPEREEDPAHDEAEADEALLGQLEWLLFAVALRPVVEEFFFRGVLYQGAAGILGTRGAILVTTLLFGLARFAFGLLFGTYAGASFGAQALVEGSVLGTVRAASGSLFPCILLHAALQLLGAASLGFADSLPIAGFNAPGAHTPAEIVALCAVSVLLGVLLMLRLKRPDPPDASEAPPA